MSLVNTGAAPNDNTGDFAQHAFELIDAKLTYLESIAPNIISGANALTLDNASINERVPRGTLIGNLGNTTAGSTLRFFSTSEYRFQINGTRLEAGPWLLDVGNTTVIVEEVVVTAIGTITRQTVLNITVNRDAVNWPAVVPTVWVAPVAQGTGDGSSAANAKLWTSVPGTLTPGAIVGLRADLGPYVRDSQIGPVVLTSSGTAGNPIKWIGVDSTGKRTLAKLTAGRWAYRKQSHDSEEIINLFTFVDSAPSQIQGGNVFQFGGISYVEFEDLFFEDVQVCFNQSGGNPDHLSYRRIHTHNVQRAYEHTAASQHTNTLWDGSVAFGFSKSLIRCRGTTSNVTIQNFYADAQRQDNDQWSCLSQIDNTASNILIQNGTILNCHNNEGSGYSNGDGISSEENNPGIQVINVVTMGHTDAGVDLKSSASVIGLTVGDSKRGGKFWNGEFDCPNWIFLPPKKRGNGSGSACHLNINQNIAGKCPHVRVTGNGTTTGDLRLFGQANAYEIDFDSGLQTNAGAVVKYINVQRDAVPQLKNSGAWIRFMIAAAAPVGAIALTANSANLNEGSVVSIPIATNRDAAHGGVLIRAIGGPDAALFKVNGLGGVGKHGQTISPISPIAWTNTAADAKSITLDLEDVAGNTLNGVAFTVNVQQDTTDYRVLDVSFRGADNSQTATDASPSHKALTWGSGAKIRTTIDPLGRLRINFTANGTGTGRVTLPDSPDWTMDNAATLLVQGVNLDNVATGIVQTIVSQWNNTSGGRSFRLYVDGTGHVTFEVSADGNATAFLLADPTARTNATDFDVEVTRTFVAGSNWRWDLWVNGTIVQSVTNSIVPKDVAQILAIGATSASRDYMAGYLTRLPIYKGKSNGS